MIVDGVELTYLVYDVRACSGDRTDAIVIDMVPNLGMAILSTKDHGQCAIYSFDVIDGELDNPQLVCTATDGKQDGEEYG